MSALYENLKTLYHSQKRPLSDIREWAWKKFQLPESNSPLYRHVRRLYNHTFQLPQCLSLPQNVIDAHTLPECTGSTLVFINGYFSPEHSQLETLSKQCEVLSLSKAYDVYRLFLHRRFHMEKEDNPFLFLNTALHGEGAFVYLPPRRQLNSPIQVLYLTTDNATIVSTRLHLFLGAASCATVYTRSISLGGNIHTWNNQVTDIVCEKQSSLIFVPHLEGEGWYLDAMRTTLKEETQCESIAFLGKGDLFAQDYRIALEGERSSAKIGGGLILKGKSEAHINVGVELLAPFAQSEQSFRSVLNDTSRSSFRGRIHVQKEAQKTESYQLNRSLLLSEGARVVSEPVLEIFADDVKASHGATIGQLEEDEIFYLKSRGLSEEEARMLLIKAFIREIIEKIPLASARVQALSQLP